MEFGLHLQLVPHFDGVSHRSEILKVGHYPTVVAIAVIEDFVDGATFFGTFLANQRSAIGSFKSLTCANKIKMDKNVIFTDKLVI